MAARVRLLTVVLVLGLLFFCVGPARASSIEELERQANSDFIPEVRAAASKALTQKYVEEELGTTKLEKVAGGARTDELRSAAVRAIASNFEDVKRVGSLKEALKKAKELEKTVRKGGSVELREAASQALGIYYLAFNLNEIDGYSLKALESTVKKGDHPGLAEAAATALESVYPNHYSADRLKELILETDNELLKRAAAGGLSILYYSQISPDISLEELREIASNEEIDSWLRKAAGDAYGELARTKVPAKKLKNLARNAETEELRQGAASAWSKVLINSDLSREELLGMACAATGYAPEAYRSALISALADRIEKQYANSGGGR